MKKLALIVLCLAVFVGLSVAQNPTYAPGSTGGIHGIDKLGAHQNGGRGCTGCHAPHSGGAGGGGNAVSGLFNDPKSGNDALFGQDLTPLYGYTLAFGDNGQYVEVLPTSFAVADEEIRGIMMCLACHDGNVAKGGMMTGVSYEQAKGLLPANLYGPRPIPTLLGNDGSTAGNYNNDHPVGVNATLGKLGNFNNYFIVNGTSGKWAVNAASTAYVQFIANYGAPTFYGRTPPALPTGVTDPNQAFLLCTTCHTPHSMYTSSASASNPIAGLTSGVFPTYFFIAAPYNPGALPGGGDGTKASSATQFCRQCHFTGAGGSNEGSGIMNVATAF
jgi:hypothetical protein